MSIGLLGKKLGMTHVYDEYGRRVAVTAVQAGPCTVIQLRQPNQHRYAAVQLGFEPVKDTDLTKPRRGQFKKAGTSPFRYIREFRLRPVSDTSNGPSGGQVSGTGDWKVGQ